MAKGMGKRVARMFEVGDVVKVLKGRHKGKLARIDDVDTEGDDRPYLYTLLTRYTGAWLDAEDLQLHERAAKPATAKAA